MTVTVGALSVGPVAARAISTPGAAARLHSIFPSTVNLAVEGSEILIALTGPSGTRFPHAVALEQAVSFPELPIANGDCGHVSAHCILIQGKRGRLMATLDKARRPPPRVLPLILQRAECWRACVRWLDDFQSKACCELRMSALLTGPGGASSLGAMLQSSARALGRAAAAERGCRAALPDAVSSLVGAGTGLTPSGDDFLSGFMAALRAGGRERLAAALGKAVEKNLGATGDISASLLRCGVEGFWPEPLLDLADAIAAENTPAALRALASLCGLGHSSGADMASGFLFGLACLLKEWE